MTKTNNTVQTPATAKPVRSEFVYKSVTKGLQFMFETRASEGIKGASYQEPTSGSTVTNKLSQHDRHAMAAWTQQTAQKTLSAAQWAWAVCAHDGHGEARYSALNTLADHFASLHKNRDMLRDVIERELQLGETYALSLPTIAKQTGASLRTTERVSSKVRAALASMAEQVTAVLQDAFYEKGYVRSAR